MQNSRGGLRNYGPVCSPRSRLAGNAEFEQAASTQDDLAVPIWRNSDIAGRVEKIIVFEMNMGQLIGEVERATCGKCGLWLPRVDGEPIAPAEIVARIEEV